MQAQASEAESDVFKIGGQIPNREESRVRYGYRGRRAEEAAFDVGEERVRSRAEWARRGDLGQDG